MSNRPITEKLYNNILHAQVGNTVTYRQYSPEELTEKLLAARKMVEMLDQQMKDNLDEYRRKLHR